MTQLTIQFETKEKAVAFSRWLNGGGEQDYWTWMDGADDSIGRDLTVKRFDYSDDDLTITAK